MPQVDLVCGGDPKVACEPPPDPLRSDPNPPHSDPYPDPDLPAESFRIPITGDLLDFLDVVNSVYDRDDSTKGTTNPKSQHEYNNHHHQPTPPAANSQRFSGNLKATAKAPIIALPNKLRHSGYLGHSTRKSHGGRIFPRKAVGVLDPGSPKVSCFGKVLSQREKACRRGSPAVDESRGCWTRLAAFFCCFGRREDQLPAASETKGNNPVRERKVATAAAAGGEVVPDAEPLGLGGMKRFVSGRRPASWGGDAAVDLEENGGHVAWSGPLVRQ